LQTVTTLPLFLLPTKHLSDFVGNEIIGPNLTWAHNLFMKWVLGFPTLGHSRYRDSK